MKKFLTCCFSLILLAASCSKNHDSKIQSIIFTLPSGVEASAIEEIEVGATLVLGLAVLPSGASVPVEHLQWSSSDVTVATVTSKGVIQGKSIGTCDITLRIADVSKSITIRVKAPKTLVREVGFNKSFLSLVKGNTYQLVATIAPSNASVKDLQWASTKPQVATVDQTGKITAVSAGTTIVSATSFNGKKAKCTVTVSDAKIPLKSISLNKQELDLTIGSSEVLSVTFSPADATTVDLDWSSTKEHIAKVDARGRVVAVGSGRCMIIVKSGAVRDACVVNVTDPVVAVTSVAINPATLTMQTGGNAVLTATVLPANATDKSVVWNSTDPTVATVSNGSVHALKAGTTTITATSANGKEGSCVITVTDPVVPVESVVLSPATLSMETGGSSILTATVLPANATDKSVVWNSTDPTVATVSNGSVHALKAGTTTITATSANGKEGSCVVTVTDPVVPVESVALSPATLSMETGGSSTLTATVLPANATDKSVVWNSTDPTVATVSNGTVTALKAGTTTITATSANGKEGRCVVTVTDPVVSVESVALSPATLSMETGGSSTLTATVLPTTATNKSLVWNSTDPTVATVNNGMVTALKAGTTTITATSANGKEGRCVVTVTDPVVPVESVALSPATLSMETGGSSTLTATVLPTTATDKSLVWNSTDPTVATVSNGNVHALKAGTTTITATSANGKEGRCVVTVTDPVVAVTSVAIVPATLTMQTGGNAVLIARVLPTNATDKSVVWNSTDPTVATVSNGNVHALKAGTTTITATSANGKEGRCVVTVQTIGGEDLDVHDFTIKR